MLARVGWVGDAREHGLGVVHRLLLHDGGEGAVLGRGWGGSACGAFFRLARLDTRRSCWLWPEPEPGLPSCRIIRSVSSIVAAATASSGI